jgi:hypothetical protein
MAWRRLEKEKGDKCLQEVEGLLDRLLPQGRRKWECISPDKQLAEAVWRKRKVEMLVMRKEQRDGGV